MLHNPCLPAPQFKLHRVPLEVLPHELDPQVALQASSG